MQFPSFLLFLGVLLFNTSCAAQEKPAEFSAQIALPSDSAIVLGVERIDMYLPMLKGKRVGMIVNHSSQFIRYQDDTISTVHVIDSLVKLGVDIVKIFAPEHGFRGTADAGEKVQDGKDIKTGLPILSLYGKNRRPSKEMIEGVDVLIFDIQDVGVRFYTYISTLEYCMDEAAKNNIEFIVFDRPNPNGHYVDGPILDKKFQSFVGRHEIPIVHGLTVGEYAQMLVGEKWIETDSSFKLTIVPCLNYNHSRRYELPIAPSPNLPTQKSILLYPSLCLFEGTVMSIGRGTLFPFQVVGHPLVENKNFSFTPKPMKGAKNPKLNGKECYGTKFYNVPIDKLNEIDSLNVAYIIDYYNIMNSKLETSEPYFLANNFIDKLAGTDEFRKDILAGKSAKEVKSRWRQGIMEYKLTRQKYLLYGD